MTHYLISCVLINVLIVTVWISGISMNTMNRRTSNTKHKITIINRNMAIMNWNMIVMNQEITTLNDIMATGNQNVIWTAFKYIYIQKMK